MKDQMENIPQIVSREDEAKVYLETHKINDLLTNLTAQLVYHKPEKPKEFIVEFLEKLRKAKVASLQPPTLLDEQNFQSIFGMLDPTGKGSITHKQYIEALETLGVKNYDENPDGSVENRIKMETFVKEA